MDAIIPPGNTQLLTTEHRRHHDRHDWATVSQVQLEGMEDRINTDVNGSEGRLVTNANSSEARLATAANAAEARLVTNQNGFDVRSTVEREGLETRLNVDGRLDAVRSDIDRTSDKTQAEVERFGFSNLDESDKQGWRNQVETRFYGLKNFEATKDALKDVLLQANENAFKMLSKQDEHYAAIQLEAAKNHGAAQAKLIETKYQLELEAQKTASILAAQIAECCCENKMLIIEKADRTDALIRSLDEGRYKYDLSKANDELVALRLRASLTPALTPAVTV